MSNCYSGKDGALAVGGTNVAMLTSWSVSQSAETLECTSMGGNGWKDYKDGLKSWEGSAEANFANSTAEVDNANALVTVGSTVVLTFYPDAADTGVSFAGSAIVTSVENGASLGDIQAVSLSFTGTGALVTDLTPA